MKICLLNPTVIMRRPISELALLLSREGNEVSLMTPMERNKDKNYMRHTDYYSGKEKISIIAIHSIEIKKILFSIPYDWSFFKKINQALRENDILQIWAPYYFIAMGPLFLKKIAFRKKYKAKIILTFDFIAFELFTE